MEGSTGTTSYWVKLRSFIDALWSGKHSAATCWIPLSSSLNWLCKALFSKQSVGRFWPLHSLIMSSLLICWKRCTPPFLLSLPGGPPMTFFFRSSKVIHGALSDAMWLTWCNHSSHSFHHIAPQSQLPVMDGCHETSDRFQWSRRCEKRWSL